MRQTTRGPQPREPGRPPEEEDDGRREAAPLRRFFAELFGTFALTLVAAGGEVIGTVSRGQVGPTARAVAPGLLVMAMINTIGDVSGAHLNPAVSLAFAWRRDFAWSRLPGYWTAQVLGAVVAALLLRAVFGPVAHLGATRPHYGVGAALVMEVVLTTLLVTVILGTATRHMVVGPHAALAVGATIALCGLFAGPVSGASMNPARSLGPALVGGVMADVWIYLAGPFTGATLAVGMVWLLHGRKKPGEVKAASGEQG